MKVSQVEQEHNQVVLNIEVDPHELEEHLEVVFKKAVHRVNIPGFRKGKAPRSVVERQLGRTNMIDDALDTLLPQITSRAIQEKAIDAVATPRVKVLDYEPLIIEAIVAMRPEIALGDYKSYRLDQEDVVLSDQDVDDVIQSMQRDSATWEPVKRKAVMEDMVTMEVVGRVNEEAIIDQQSVDYIPSEGSSNPMPGFSEKLIELDVDKQSTFSLPFPDDYVQHEIAGKQCEFTITIKEVKERVLPELDDEFAKSLGTESETMSDLREKISDDLLKHNQSMSDQQYQETVVQALIDNTSIDLPPLLVDHEVQHMLSEQSEAAQRQNVRMEDYLKTVGKTAEQLEDELRPTAVQRLTRGLVLTQLRQDEGIEVSQEEIEDELVSIINDSSEGNENLRQFLESDNGKASIGSILLNRKTLNLLTSLAKGELGSEESGATENTDKKPTKTRKRKKND